MHLNKIAKALLIAVPAIALTACSNTSSTETDSTVDNNQQAVVETTSGVVTGGAEKVKSPEEIQREQQEALRKEQMVYFSFDKSVILADYREMLDAHAAFLSKNANVSVMIEGHADERGTPEYNIALGERRAQAVATYLQNSGVSAAQITTVSYGEEKPLVRGFTESAFAKNRRAVLVY